MAVATIHTLHGIQTPSSFLSQLSNVRCNLNHDVVAGFAAGWPQPLFQGIIRQRPEFAFTTQQLSTLLNLCGAFGADLSGGNTDLYWRKATEFGSRQAAASAVHQRVRAAQAMLFWNRISAAHGRVAEADCRLLVPYDGTNDPLVFAGSVALAGTPVASEYFTLGPVRYNSGGGDVTINGVQDCGVDAGIRPFQAGGDGEPWDTFVGLGEVAPGVTLRALDFAPPAALSIDGLALTAWTVYFRRIQADGAAYANAATQHIKITGAAGLLLLDDQQAGDNREGTISLTIRPRAASAAADWLTITLGSAIT